MPQQSEHTFSPNHNHNHNHFHSNLYQPQAINPLNTALNSPLTGFSSSAGFDPASFSQPGVNHTTMITDSVHSKYGQITPPEDHWKQSWDTSLGQTVNPDQFMASRPRSQSGDSSNSGVRGSSNRVDKKDKYREKNRVAAAKCRAKKKEHTDGLEENHRTQSMLNSLLKQTEQNLRDELSFWRTQALQHAFCDCSAIQEYNMKKARALASDNKFGGGDVFRRDSMNQSPPSSKVGGVPYYQQPHPEFDTQPS
ncbi:bZIP transcription factor-like protein [Elsinoe australis]|uniref:BZIP transcription factor-like protein n=1 Tax=Elsinoe australis TaxID=40998 RepID=A0A4U7B589_9PEZI|nr:bZIP transcription factor-like protein [Elsinoe australis]